MLDIKPMKLYSTEQAKQILGYSNQSVMRTAIKRGQIKAVRVGSFWVIPESEIKRMMTERGLDPETLNQEIGA